MEVYWNDLLKNLCHFLRVVREKEKPEERLFEGFDIHLGSKNNNRYPAIELIWMTEQGFAINREGDNRRQVRFAADLFVKYVRDNTDEFQARFYDAQCRFVRALRYWQEFVGEYTFPGSVHYGVVARINQVYSDGELAREVLPCRFDITLDIKEDSRRANNYGSGGFIIVEGR